MILPYWGPLGRPLGGLLARFGGHLSRLGTILGVLGRSLGVSGPSWTTLGASWARLEAVLVRFGTVWEPLETPPEEGPTHVQGGSLPGARGPGSPIYVYICISSILTAARARIFHALALYAKSDLQFWWVANGRP